MPNRCSKTMKKRQDREQYQDWTSSIEWFSGDDDDSDDQVPPDDFYTSAKYKTKKNRQNVAAQSSVVPTYPSDKPCDTSHLTEKSLNDRQLPDQIFKIFSNIKSKNKVINVLKGIQDEEDRYWQSKDEKFRSRQTVIEHFQRIKYTDFEQENGKQILKYLQNPILRKSQYGVLLFNSERQIFVVQNHDGIWNAPMSYQKIDKNYQLETIIETVSRGFNEQISAKHQLTDEIESYDLQDDQHLDSHKYIEKHTDNDLIGLFISEFDRPIIEFELHKTNENQVNLCQWISIDDIINQTSCEQFDRFRSLRPFVQYVFDLLQKPTKNEIIFQNNLNNTVETISTMNLKTEIQLKTPLCIREEIFDHAQSFIEFPDDRNQMLDEFSADTLVMNYIPKILARFNLSLRLPKTHMGIEEYKQCILRKLFVPYYNEPNVNSIFPLETHSRTFRQPKEVSILPLLIIAQRNRVNIQNYDIISERNSLRKIALNNENYVIGVKRIGTMLFLRRHDKRNINKNEVGLRFEQMCRPDYHLDAEFKLLLDSRIGNLRVLITAETDVICRQTNQSIELKSRLNSNTINQPADCWVQAFLCGTKTVIVGQRTADEPPRLVDINEYNTSSIISDKAKERILRFLYQVLCFLRENVKQDGSYLFSRRYDSRSGKRSLFLYKIADKHEQELIFVTVDLLKQLNFKL